MRGLRDGRRGGVAASVLLMVGLVVGMASVGPTATASPFLPPPPGPDALFQAGPIGAPACIVDVTDMLGWWKGSDDLLGTVGPTLDGTVAFTDAVVGRGMQFDGSNIVSTDTLGTVSTGVSVEGWIQPVDSGQTQALFSRWTWVGGDEDDSYALFLGVNSELFWITDEMSTRSAESLSASAPQLYDGQFHHVAATWNQAEMTIYVDGQLVATQPSQGGTLNPGTNTQFRLGSSGGIGNPLSYTGVLDEATVYDRSLSGAEVAAIHEAGSEGKCPPGDPSGTQVELLADDGAAGDLFGYSVAVNGTTMAIGAPVANGPGGLPVGSGSVYVFTRTGTTWSQQAELTATDARAGANFGWSVGLDGNTLVVGAPNDRPNGGAFQGGSAYVFTRSGTTWSQEAKLTAASPAVADNFGYSVAVNGATAVVGAYRDDTAFLDAGSATVFTRSGTVWAQQALLTPGDAAASDTFGFSVSISGESAIVGAVQKQGVGVNSGAAYVFARTGTAWAEQAKLTASDSAAGDSHGFSVALNGTTAIVGAPNVDGVASNTGAAYVYTRSGTTWTPQTKLVAGDATGGAVFGRSVAVNLNSAMVGAPLDDSLAVDSGSAYLFNRSGTTWSQTAKLTAVGGLAQDLFGFDVTLNSSTAAAGAPNRDTAGTNSGAAYVFTLF